MSDVEPSDDPRACSREGCTSRLPPGTEIPEGWTIARVEKFKRDTVEVYHLYICPSCVLTATEKQGQLF